MDETPNIDRYEKLVDEFRKVMILKDEGVMKLLIGTVVANSMNGDPNWIFLVGNSSGGKSEFINTLLGILSDAGRPLMFPVSDLTVNTFASGQKKAGKETSLLHKIPPGGMLVFKDFTSMISKNDEAKAQILGQMREIYDGSYVKRTGTGDDVVWKGKIGAIAGCTEIIYENLESLSAMGDRFLLYGLAQPERMEILEFMMSDERVNANREQERRHLQACVRSYVSNVFSDMDSDDVVLSDEVKRELMEVADFCTRVRSGLITDKRDSNVITFIPSIEMPMRMLHQLNQLAKAFIKMRKIELAGDPKMDCNLTESERKIIYKIAFDSIPIKRRMAISTLAEYQMGVSSRALAVKLNYQTKVIAGWMAQLNALGICVRDENYKGGLTGDKWIMLPKYRDTMAKFNDIIVRNEALELSEEDEAAALAEQSWGIGAAGGDDFGDFKPFQTK